MVYRRAMLLVWRLAALLLLKASYSTTVVLASTKDDEANYLDENSVVLITGAAGFLGSELAMALYRTFEPKALVLVDSMDQGFGQPNDSSDLAIFEFKRQRIFHILQTIENKRKLVCWRVCSNK